MGLAQGRDGIAHRLARRRFLARDQWCTVDRPDPPRATSSHNLPRELGLLLDFDPVQEDIQPILDAGAPFIGSARLSIEIERPLLNAGILTFDGLVNLRGLPLDQTFEFYGFPLKIREGDGSPIRAIAILE